MNREALWIPAAKLAVFAVVATFVLLTIAGTITPIGSTGSRTTFTAELTSASRLVPGDDVRVAGVPAGTVTDVSVTSGGQALVEIELDDDLTVTTATRVEIRYLNLVGDRYVALVDDVAGGAAPAEQDPDEPIGLDRTLPALDLNAVLGGFKPLFQALEPGQVNALALDIVQTLQGDGATVQALISHTADLTTGLAERDQLISDTIVSLDAAVGTVSQRHTELAEIVSALQTFVGGLDGQRQTVADAVVHLEEMTRLTADLLQGANPAITADVAALGEIAATLVEPANREMVEHVLDHVPDKLDRLIRTASYGSFFNYYLCAVRFTIDSEGNSLLAPLQQALAPVVITDPSPRCD